MAYAFHRHREGYVGRLNPEERQVLLSLMSQVHSLLARPPVQAGADEFETLLREAGLARLGDELPGATPDDDGSDDPDRDPALDRLLPDAHRTDPLLASEFRRMAGPGLRDRKAATLARAIAAIAANGDGPDGDRHSDGNHAGRKHAERAHDGGAHDGRSHVDGRQGTEAAPDESVLRDGEDREEEVRLDEEQAQAVAIALTDVRLVVGERLGLRTDADADRLEGALASGSLDGEGAWLVAVYDFLTWLQESLTMAMLGGSPAE